jgi:hypothetical protein
MVPQIDFQDHRYVFVVFDEADTELCSQTFHPRLYNDFISVYEWERSSRQESTRIKNVYLSSTEHDVVITLTDDVAAIEISVDRSDTYEPLLTLERDSDWNSPSGTVDMGLLVFKHTDSPVGTTLTLSVFGTPGYYKIVLLPVTGDIIDSLETFIGSGVVA